LRTRSLELEVLDDPNVPPEELLAALNFMAWVNRRLGGTQAILDFFEKNPTPQEFSVLDLGFGAGDIPYALVEWAKSKGKKVSVTAIDLNPSGTRKEERLLSAAALAVSHALRRSLTDRGPVQAMEQLLERLEKYPTNEQFIAKFEDPLLPRTGYRRL